MAWILHAPLTTPLVVAAELVVPLYFYFRAARPKLDQKSWVDTEDWIALAATATSIMVLCVFILHAGPNLGTLIRFSALSTDETVHLDLTLRDYQSQGYQYGIKTASPYDASPYYPQGWHLVNALWWRALSDNFRVDSISHLSVVLTVYLITRLLWYALLIYMFCRVVLYICRSMWPKRLTKLEAPAVFILIGGIQLIWFIEILHAGFSSFMLQLLLSLVLMVLVTELVRPSERIELNAFLLTVSLLTAGMSLTWLLTLPIGIATILLALLVYYGRPYLSTLQLVTSPRHRLAAIMSVLIVLAGMVQVYIQVHYSHGAVTLNTAGGIDPVNYLLTSLLAGIAIWVVFTSKNTVLRYSLANVLTWPLLLTGAVYIYEQWSTGQTSYYSIKLEWLVALVFFTFGCAMILGLMRTLDDQLQTVPALLCLGALILLAILSSQTPLNSLQFLHYRLSVSSRVANEIVKAYPEIIRPQPNTSVIVASNYLSEDTVASAFLNVIHHDIVHGCWFPATQSEIPGQIEWYRFDNSVLCYTNKHYVILTGDNVTNVRTRYGSSAGLQLIY